MLAVLVAGPIGVAADHAVNPSLSSDRESNAIVAVALAMMAWLLATVFLWRETTAGQTARASGGGSSAVTRPICGDILLTGPADARDPECGSRFTPDDLLAAQPARPAAGELERRREGGTTHKADPIPSGPLSRHPGRGLG